MSGRRTLALWLGHSVFLRIDRGTLAVGCGLGEAALVRMQQRDGACVGAPGWFVAGLHLMRLVDGWDRGFRLARALGQRMRNGAAGGEVPATCGKVVLGMVGHGHGFAVRGRYPGSSRMLGAGGVCWKLPGKRGWGWSATLHIVLRSGAFRAARWVG
eukprot:3892419-Alexandrium_andersonii.AAC.2